MKPRIKAWNITSGVTQSLCDLMSWLQAVMAQKEKKLYNPVHLFSFINNPALTFCSTDSCHMQNVIPHIFNGFNSVPNILKAEAGRWSGDLLRIWCVFVCENNRAWRFSVVSFVPYMFLFQRLWHSESDPIVSNTSCSGGPKARPQWQVKKKKSLIWH